MTNDWTLYTKDGGRVEIYSISQFGDDLQLSRFPPRKRQACALGALKPTGPWRSFLVKISRGSDVEPPQAPQRKQKRKEKVSKHHPLVSFHSGCFIGKTPNAKSTKRSFVDDLHFLRCFVNMLQVQLGFLSSAWVFTTEVFYWEIMRVVLRNALGLKQH